MYLKKRIETIFHNVIRKTGYDIVKCKYSRAELEIEQLLSLMQIGCVLDIGANEGQYAKHLRIGGYKKKIISFEPIKEPFIKLAKLSVKDQLWEIHNMALGDHDGQAEINISANSVSSSLLGMKNSHLEAAPESKYVGIQNVDVRCLDSIFSNLNIGNQNIYLKIDTQGFEKNVLDGAKDSLKQIKAVQLEMSVQPLYEGEYLYFQLSDFLYEKGFRLIKIVRGLTRSNGELLQFDGVFMRD